MLGTIIIGIAVIGVILYRQMRPTPVGASPKTALVLCVIGAVTAAKALAHSAATPVDVTILAASTALGLAIAVVRAHTVHIYRDPETGTAFGRGTAVTAGLWLLGIGAHVGLDAVASSGLGGSTLLFYLGSVLLVQNLIVTARARRAGLPVAGTSTTRVVSARR